MSQLKLTKTLWGVTANPDNWERLFERIKNENYSIIEVIPLTYQNNQQLFLSLLNKYG